AGGLPARCQPPHHLPLHAEACLMDQSDRDLVLYPGAQAAPPWQLHFQGASQAADRGVHRLLQPDHGQALPLDHEGPPSHRVRHAKPGADFRRGVLVQQLAAHEQRRFADHAAWQRHLEQLGMTALQVTSDPVRVATEGALWGAVADHGFLHEAVIVSDDAGQFNVGQHGLCWVHAERLVHKLETFTDQQRAAQQHVRGLIWWYYADLKAYRLAPTSRRRSEMRARFDRIFLRTTGFATLDRLLQRLHANKAELLMVLDHPEIPLHTNGSENDIRCQVTK